MSGLADVLQEPFCIVVHDEPVGEFRFLQKRQNKTVVGNGGTEVRIAPQYDRHFVVLAQTQYLEVVGEGFLLATHGIEAAVIDFEQGVRLFRRQHNRLEEEFGSAVARMGDDVYPRVSYGIHHALSVFLDGAALPAKQMYAGYAEVEQGVDGLVEVDCATGIEDVQFGSKQESEVPHLSGHDMKVAEINGVARAGDSGGVFRNAQYVEPLLLSHSHHLLKGAVGMAAHNGMCVDVK